MNTDAVQQGPTQQTSPVQRKAWVSGSLLAACVAVFLIAAPAVLEGEEQPALTRMLHQPTDAVWDGAWWVLVTSVLVHWQLWHIGGNAYWLWELGSCMEREVGSAKFLAFCVGGGFVSSAFQLAHSDDVGIGASGVVYAVFGFMIAARGRYPSFRERLTPLVVVICFGWFVLCFGTHFTDQPYRIGNAAHASGLLWGLAIGAAAAAPRIRFPSLAAAGLLIGFSITVLLWCPWSKAWLSGKAYRAHLAEQFHTARHYYNRLIDKQPADSWAFHNRGYANLELNEFAQAVRDFDTARKLDPSLHDDPNWLTFRIVAADALGDNGTVLNLCDRLLAKHPEDSYATAMQKRATELLKGDN